MQWVTKRYNRYKCYKCDRYCWRLQRAAASPHPSPLSGEGWGEAAAHFSCISGEFQGSICNNCDKPACKDTKKGTPGEQYCSNKKNDKIEKAIVRIERRDREGMV